MKLLASNWQPNCCSTWPSPSCKWKEFCKKERWNEYKKALEAENEQIIKKVIPKHNNWK